MVTVSTSRREFTPAAQQLAPKPGAAELIAELDQLAELKDAGVLSEAEFARQRAEVLAGLV